MRYIVLIFVNLLLLIQPLSSGLAKEPLKDSLEEFIADVQKVIEQTEPVFRDSILLQWAKLTFGIRHMTYIVGHPRSRKNPRYRHFYLQGDTERLF